MTEILVDSDIFIDHLRGAREFVAGNDAVSYSTVTRCELFAGRSVDEAVVQTLLAPFRELDVDRTVAEKAGRLRCEMGLRTPDALIAATALVHGLALVTRNSRDFSPVPDLVMQSPGRVGASSLDG